VQHPQAVNRWALRLDQPPANPGAGRSIGTAGSKGPAPGEEAVTMGPAGSSSNQQWHPDVVSLLVLIVVEIAAYSVLRWAFRTAHGG